MADFYCLFVENYAKNVDFLFSVIELFFAYLLWFWS